MGKCIVKCSVCGVVDVEMDDEFDCNPPVCSNKDCVTADCDRHHEENAMPDIGDCYPDGRFDGAFEHKSDICPECGNKNVGPNKLIACEKCNWTDF